ncbi:TPA: HNH endonuclease [Burkholderia contaminans]|nr:HNH endonuclease [Burkholderia contaminans]
MMMSLQECIDRLPARHKAALLWFHEHQGKEVSWPKPMPDGTFLVNKAKGIHKPAGWEYALSVRQSLGGPYADHDPVIHADGSWIYRYFQEQADPTKRDSQFTNVALLACQRDEVPVGVIRQVKGKPNPRYQVMGLALVREWDDGYFRFDGFGPSGALNGGRIREAVGGMATATEAVFNPSSVEDARQWIDTSIVRRQGQGKFRADVLAAYGYRCAISDCDVPDALEAAHIFRYFGMETNVVTNGLLLRSDLHTLYDLGLVAIDPSSMTVMLAPKLKATCYAPFGGRAVRLPQKTDQHPSLKALEMHAKWATGTWGA